MSPSATLVRDVVIANRVLARFGIVDAFGHVSVRDPRDPGRYLISRSLAPESVEDDDVVLLDLDSAPSRTERRLLYAERFIHGEIYRSRPDVQAVVHHHSPTTVAFGVTGTPLRAIFHMAPFLGDGLPVYEIREAAAKATDMLVRSPELARALARTVGEGPAALMRGHGAVVVGRSLSQVVARSVYMEVNARIQLDAIRLGGPVRYLDPEESDLAAAMHGDYPRAWELWKQAVSVRGAPRPARTPRGSRR
jgi:ribulose-5-phosphate 4-epimerase/fuculose-1-phosphate aldolase